MATILTKKKDTTGAPSSGDLTNSTGGAELAVNTADKRLYTKDSGGAVVEVGINPTSITTGTLNTSGQVVFNDAGADVDFRVEGDTEPNLLFVDASADAVGIGTSSPTSNRRLDAVINANASAGIRVVNSNAGTTTSSNTLYNNGTISHEFGILGTGYSTYGVLAASDAYIYASGDKNIAFGADGANAIIKFGTGAGVTERMRIHSDGFVTVAKTGTSFTVGDGYVFGNDGQAGVTSAYTTNAASTWRVYSTGAGAYRFFVGYDGVVNATNATISAISDQRLKENIRDLDVGLAEIMQLQPRVFDWKEGKGKDVQNDRGFIAQEFEQVFPDLVNDWIDPVPEGEEPYKSVRQDLIPVLVKAIQEQQAIIESLKSRLDAAGL